MNLEELLKAAIDDGVRSVPPGFADGAIRRARRQVRTTRIVIAGGVAAFAMAAAAVAVVDPADLRTDAPPARTPDPAPAVLVDDVTDFDAVGTGAAPSVPWYADDALHFEDTSTPFDLSFAELSVDRVAGGYVALVVPPGGEHPDDVLYLVPDGGTPEQVDSGELSEVVVSPDGAEFAYAAEVAGTGGLPSAGEMRVADARTGDRPVRTRSWSIPSLVRFSSTRPGAPARNPPRGARRSRPTNGAPSCRRPSTSWRPPTAGLTSSVPSRTR